MGQVLFNQWQAKEAICGTLAYFDSAGSAA
jgi:hypothetical protein